MLTHRPGMTNILQLLSKMLETVAAAAGALWSVPAYTWI